MQKLSRPYLMVCPSLRLRSPGSLYSAAKAGSCQLPPPGPAAAAVVGALPLPLLAAVAWAATMLSRWHCLAWSAWGKGKESDKGYKEANSCTGAGHERGQAGKSLSWRTDGLQAVFKATTCSQPGHLSAAASRPDAGFLSPCVLTCRHQNKLCIALQCSP
jgi:hypothetical protein